MRNVSILSSFSSVLCSSEPLLGELALMLNCVHAASMLCMHLDLAFTCICSWSYFVPAERHREFFAFCSCGCMVPLRGLVQVLRKSNACASFSLMCCHVSAHAVHITWLSSHTSLGSLPPLAVGTETQDAAVHNAVEHEEDVYCDMQLWCV